ncbi:flagellar brake protein [Massilia sp. TS11]|uniref:flagellar brake protein n=1 Tax=Massilia sp. TS11 TaxID=2908003 RepID=UPI001EDAC086|nr:flagellar brake protein [Massilia sp. TS11]MCG2586873.1 flagellar brake protein [Massilia sp. TS11]
MAYVSDNDEEFSVYDEDVIAMNLLNLAKRATPLNATFNGGSDVLVTVVLDVDRRAGQMYLDINANDMFNQQLLASRRVMYHALHDGVKLLWHGNSVVMDDYEGQRAFRIPLPDRLQRIQRRGAYRVKTPITNPVLCKIQIDATREVTMPLFDICVEGVGVVVPQPVDPAIQKMVLFKNCKLSHEELGEVEVTVLVKALWEVTRHNGTKVQHAGLEFVNIPLQRQTQIQRFVHKLERQMIATMKPT